MRVLGARLTRASAPTDPAFAPGSAPVISVVIPSYNQGRFIRATLQSIFDQQYPRVEVIVIDGGSKDDTRGVLEEFDKQIAYWVMEPDRGQSHALNKGFAVASGDILAWQNADDIYLPGAFAAVVDAFVHHPGKTIVYGDFVTIDESGAFLGREPAFDFSLRQLIFEGFHLNAQATFWRRGVQERFGEFDEQLHRTMDYDMLLRFGLREGERAFLRVATPLAAFRRHPAQKTQGVDDRVREEHRHIATRWNTKRFSWPHRWLRPVYRARRALWYVRRGGISLLRAKLTGSPWQ
jgi:glycosyltransferase involved in cell wall biosynthesis